MHANLRRGLLGTLFAGGLLALGTSVACAADTTSGSDGLASGTQVIAPVTAPVNLGATSIGLLGDSAATTGGTTDGSPEAGSPGGSTTTGQDGTLSGTQVIAPVTAPVNLGATSIGLLGDSAATNGGAATGGPAASSTGRSTTTGQDGTLSGTQVTAPVTAPVTLGATSIGLLGDSAATTGGAATGGTNEPGTDEPGTSPGDEQGEETGDAAEPGTDGSGAVVGTGGAAETVGFASTGQSPQATSGAKLQAPGAGMLAMTGANGGVHLVALVLLGAGGLLLALRLGLQRRRA